MLLKRIAFFALIVFLPLLLNAKSGLQVRDMWTLRPLPGVRLVSERDTLLSNAHGFFDLERMRALTWPVVLEKEGYFDQELVFSSTAFRIVYLMPQMATEEITVVEPRSGEETLPVPANVSRIDVSSVQSIPGLGSVEQLLREQEGVVIKSYGGTGQLQTISLRGMSAEQTQVNFDGVPLNNLQLGSVDLGKYDLSGLSAVTVYRGGNAVFGGSGAIGGVIHLVPDSIRSVPFYSARFDMGSYQNRSYLARLDFPIASLRSSLSFSGGSGENNYPASRDASDGRLNNRDFVRHRLAYRGQLDFTGNWTAQVGIYSFRHDGGAPQPFINARSETDNRARITRDETLANLKILRTFKNGRLKMQTFLRNEWMEYTDPALVINYQPLHSLHFNQQQGAQASLVYGILPNLLINAGAEWYSDKIRSSAAGNHRRTHHAFFTATDWQLFSVRDGWIRSLHLNASVRSERYPGTTRLWLPAAGFSLNTATGRWYGALGKNYRAPGFNDLYWVPGGNPDLAPEFSDNAEFGYQIVRRIYAALLSANASVFLNRVHDQIKWLPEGALWRPVNIAEVQSRGLEFRTSLEHLEGWYRLHFNYTYGRSEKQKAEFPGDQTVGNQLPYLPREVIRLRAEFRLFGWRLGVQAVRESFRYLTIQNSPDQILPAFHLLTAWLTHAYQTKHWRVRGGVTVNNLLDTRYQTLPGYPMPPRTVTVGIEFSGNRKKL